MDTITWDMLLVMLLAALVFTGIVFYIIGFIRIIKEFGSKRFKSRGFLYCIIGLAIEITVYVLNKFIDYTNLNF